MSLPIQILPVKNVSAQLANLLRRTLRAAFLACCVVALAAPLALLPLTVSAQQDSARTVQGRVVDKSETALKGATVYLKDEHTLAVKSYLSSDDGTFHFGQLVQSSDYQVWAELDGKKSAVKNISSFDTRKEFNVTLKIEK